MCTEHASQHLPAVLQGSTRTVLSVTPFCDPAVAVLRLSPAKSCMNQCTLVWLWIRIDHTCLKLPEHHQCRKPFMIKLQVSFVLTSLVVPRMEAKAHKLDEYRREAHRVRDLEQDLSLQYPHGLPVCQLPICKRKLNPSPAHAQAACKFRNGLGCCNWLAYVEPAFARPTATNHVV